MMRKGNNIFMPKQIKRRNTFFGNAITVAVKGCTPKATLELRQFLIHRAPHLSLTIIDSFTRAL
jgi:hypothetical protein